MKFVEPQKFVFFFPEFAGEEECFAHIINERVYLAPFDNCTKTQIKYLLGNLEQILYNKNRHPFSCKDYMIMPIEVAKAMIT